MRQLNFEDLYQTEGITTVSTFAKRLDDAMRIRGLKAVDLCEAAHLSKSVISQYLHGEYEPKRINLIKLSKALRVNPAWLCGFDVPIEKKQFTRDQFNSSIGKIIKNYRDQHGLSQRQFALLSGLSNGYISMLESGEPIYPTVLTIKKLALSMEMEGEELINKMNRVNEMDYIQMPIEESESCADDIPTVLKQLFSDLSDAFGRASEELHEIYKEKQ